MKIDKLYINDLFQDEQGCRIVITLSLNGFEAECLYARYDGSCHLEDLPCGISDGFRRTYEGLSELEIAGLEHAITAAICQYLLKSNGCMEYAGHTRKIDELGRIVLPFDLRKKMDLQEGDNLGVYTDKEGKFLVLKKHMPSTPSCCVCGSTEQLKTKNGISICLNCLNEFGC